MSNIALIGCSLASGILIFIALVTPGWFGFDMKTSDTDVSISMNMFYCRVCAKNGENGGCVTISVAKAVANSQFTMGETDRYTALMMEAIFALICIVIGVICTVIYGVTLSRRGDDTVGNSANCLGITGLVFRIIAGICGGILCIEFMIAHLDFDVSTAGTNLASEGLEKYVPYSLILMCIGLIVEFIAIVVHIVAQRNNYKTSNINGIVLSPAVNAPSQVVIQHSTVSSNPYARFA